MLLHRIFPKLTAKTYLPMLLADNIERGEIGGLSKKTQKKPRWISISALNSKATKRNCHSGNNEGNIGCK